MPVRQEAACLEIEAEMERDNEREVQKNEMHMSRKLKKEKTVGEKRTDYRPVRH